VRWDSPQSFLEIDVSPFCPAELAGTEKHERRELECQAGLLPAGVAVNGPEEGADLGGLFDRRAMSDDRRLEEPSQVERDITRGIAEAYCMSEDLPTSLLGTAGGFVHVIAFDLFEDGEQFRGGDAADWAGTEIREDEALEEPLRFPVGAFCSALDLHVAGESGQPMLCHGLEGVLPGGLFLFAVGARVGAGGEGLASGFAPVAGLTQRDIGVDSEREHLLGTLKSVPEAPPLGTIWLN
jgi:hypothetical protein